MKILEELKIEYGYSLDETVRGWLTRVLKAFLNKEDIPPTQSLASLGASSLSAAILIDLIKKETGASLQITDAMGDNSIISLENAILISSTTVDVIKIKYQITATA